MDEWPEAPFYEFLLETRQVLRDDLGIVAEVQVGEAPPNLQHLGWNHARSFILLALNKGIFHRAFEVCVTSVQALTGSHSSDKVW